MSTTEIARRAPVSITHPARFAFDSEQIAVIKRTVARECDDNEFVMFMEVVGRYQLDPFVKQVYAAKMGGTNGAGGTVSILVSRDGLLSIANRHTPETNPDDYFEGVEGDVVRGGDVLRRLPDGSFEHTYDCKIEERLQFPILGAWARCHRRGRRPTFFFAPFESYKTNNKTWQKYPDAMILKVAEAMVLRKAFSISGVIGEDEVGMSFGQPTGTSGEFAEQEPDFGTDPKLARRLELLFARANEVRPNSFLPQKVRVAMAGADQAKRERIARDVEQFILRSGGELPSDTDADEPVVDAEIVAEDASEPAA